MKHKTILGLIIIAFVVLALNVRVSYAETTNAAPRAMGYTIDWYTIDGGGAQNLQGGSYSLSGTVGQSDAGSQSGGVFSLAGGFWNAFVSSIGTNIYYLPFIGK